MKVRSERVERILRSFGFSLFLFVVWTVLTILKSRTFLRHPEVIEGLWLFYNATIAVLFLIRTTPSLVSMNLLHWLVALLASFAGMFFETTSANLSNAASKTGSGLIMLGLALGGLTAVWLGRSYDFLPAVRGVQTRWAYRVVRHPMYVASMLIRLGYLLRHTSPYNTGLFVAVALLYVLRAGFEEELMSCDPRYQSYMSKVRWRFCPGVY
jgi:protein-S-isoprenylcysteine O-methyltransferase Ste14